MSDYYVLDRALTLALKMYQKLQPEIEGVEGWQSVEEVGDTRTIVNLHLREKNKLGSICKVYIAFSEVDLEKKNLSVEIMGILDGNEFSDQKFTSSLSEYVMKEYQSLKPLVIESLLHRMGEQGEPERLASRRFEVKYRIHEKVHPKTEDYSYEFDDDTVSSSAIPYIKCMLDIHNRLYTDELK